MARFRARIENDLDLELEFRVKYRLWILGQIYLGSAFRLEIRATLGVPIKAWEGLRITFENKIEVSSQISLV